MAPSTLRICAAAGILALAGTACSDTSTGTAGMAPVTVKIAAQSAAAPTAALDLMGGPFDGNGPDNRPGPLALDQVDSLIVTVTGVVVEGEQPDSAAMESDSAEMESDSADARSDSSQMGGAPGWWGGRGWGDEVRYTLDVVGDGRIDLLNLPTDSANGLVLASGDVPPGDYRHVRLMISDASIWFNTEITTRQGTTFKPDTGYAVVIPSGDQNGVKTSAGITVPDGGGDVVLLFDASTMIHKAILTGSGEVIISPVMRCWNWRWDWQMKNGG